MQYNYNVITNNEAHTVHSTQYIHNKNFNKKVHIYQHSHHCIKTVVVHIGPQRRKFNFFVSGKSRSQRKLSKQFHR